MRKKVSLVTGVAISGLFLWLAVRNIDLQSALTALGQAEFSWSLPFLLSLFLFYWLKSQRWAVLLSPAARTTAKDLFPIVMIGYSATSILPMQLGEFVRAWIAGRRYSIAYATVLGTIAIERVFDLLIVLALLGYVLVAGPALPSIFASGGYLIGAGCLMLIAIGYLFTFKTSTALSIAGRLLQWLPDKAREGLLSQLERAADSLAVLRSGRSVFRVSLNSALQWGLMGFCIVCSLLATGIDIPLTGALLVLIATVIGISVPTGPGYVGNIQLAFVLALSAYDIDPATAFVASIFYHVLAYFAVVFVGLFFLARFGYSLTEIQRQAERADSEQPG